MNSSNATEAREDVKQMLQQQKAQAKQQLDDFKQGVYSLNSSDLAAF